MEHKSYKLEIILELLKENNHARGLAKKLNANHMTISRKIKELFKENAVDYKEDGRNKVYSLKKTAEARTYIFMSENYKLLSTIKKYPQLRRIIEHIQKEDKINVALLFGSYAKWIAKKDSDVDIFVETSTKKIKEQLEDFDSKLSVKTGKYDKKNLLIKEIEKNHVVIKGAQTYYEKNKFFE